MGRGEPRAASTTALLLLLLLELLLSPSIQRVMRALSSCAAAAVTACACLPHLLESGPGCVARRPARVRCSGGSGRSGGGGRGGRQHAREDVAQRDGLWDRRPCSCEGRLKMGGAGGAE